MAEGEVDPRPRSLPGRRHRAERDAWLQQCVGDEHAAAVGYFATYPVNGMPGQALRSVSQDVRCLLANPLTAFDDFVRILAGGMHLTGCWSSRVPYGLGRDQIPGREHWWAALLEASFPGAADSGLDSRTLACGVTEGMLGESDALIALAWPELGPQSWAPAYAVTSAGKGQVSVIQHAAAAVRPVEGAADHMRTCSLIPSRGVPRLLTRQQAGDELMRQLDWSDEALQATEELRAGIVADAIAGISVTEALDLLPTADRVRIADAVAIEGEPDGLDLLLATTPLPAEVFARHCDCGVLGHLRAVHANPFAPVDLALRALRAALSMSSGEAVNGRWGSATAKVMRALLTARGWMPVADVTEAFRAIVLEPAVSVEALALSVARAPGMPTLDARLRAGVIDRIGQQGLQVPPELVATLPSEAQAACIRAYIDVRLESSLGSVDFLEAILGMDEEVRVLAARHGGKQTLPRLAQDPGDRVRAHVARNSQTPREVLVALAADPQDAVASQVARNARVDAGLLALLAARGGRCREAATRVMLRALG